MGGPNIDGWVRILLKNLFRGERILRGSIFNVTGSEVLNGNMNSVDWNRGMEWWSGLLEWRTGLDYWSATPTNAQFGPTSIASNLISKR